MICRRSACEMIQRRIRRQTPGKPISNTVSRYRTTGSTRVVDGFYPENKFQILENDFVGIMELKASIALCIAVDLIMQYEL